AYTLRAVLRTTFGPLSGHWEKLTDVRPAESAPMMVLLGLIILIGVYPAVLGEPMQTTLHAIVARMGG
ncbi:MAG: NADH-quinone oxidoreductase subunit M, partial [Planifilum fulgidum]